MKSIRVSTGISYTVYIGAGGLNGCGEVIKAAVGLCHAVIMTDSTVGPLYAPDVKESLERAGFTVSIFTFAAGEQSKTMLTLSQVLEFMAAHELTRSDCVIALGGGVVGDMAGFAAGCYLRGIRYVQLPTTLLAAVDSSVGGKTAIDLAAGKNLAGLFWQPSAVICDTDCLRTLPRETFLDGMAEAVKTAVLDSQELFERFERGDVTREMEDLITRCVAFKARVVEADEQEQDLRKTLNLGHTIGHAVEVCSGYTVSHGHAVAIGMALIARAAVGMGYCDTRDARRIIRLLEGFGLPVHTDFSDEALCRAALHDKKRTGGHITLVLPQAIGSCVLRDIPVGELPGVIRAGREELG